MGDLGYRHSLLVLVLVLAACFTGCASTSDDEMETANGQQNGTSDEAGTEADDGIPADNIRKVLDNCKGTARDPGAFPNQLVAGHGLPRT